MEQNYKYEDSDDRHFMTLSGPRAKVDIGRSSGKGLEPYFAADSEEVEHQTAPEQELKIEKSIDKY